MSRETDVLAKYRLAQAVALVRYVETGVEPELDDHGKIKPTAEDFRRAEAEYRMERSR